MTALDRWGGSWGSSWGPNVIVPDTPTNRGGDGGYGGSRKRRKERFKTRDQLAALLSPKDAVSPEPPPPTPKRVKAVQQAVLAEIGGILAPKSVKQFVQSEVERVYQPETDWRALQAAFDALMREAAEKLEMELEAEDEEFILLMA